MELREKLVEFIVDEEVVGWIDIDQHEGITLVLKDIEDSDADLIESNLGTGIVDSIAYIDTLQERLTKVKSVLEKQMPKKTEKKKK